MHGSSSGALNRPSPADKHAGGLPTRNDEKISGFSHGSSPKMVLVRGGHGKIQEATAGHKPLDRLAPAVVWCGLL